LQRDDSKSTSSSTPLPRKTGEVRGRQKAEVISENVPARRNFLKSNPVELRHIVDEVQRVALSNSEVEFQLTHNDQEIFNLRKGNLSQRIVGIFGENYRQQLVAVDENANELIVNGYIGKPGFAKKTRGEQFFFVNNRFIKSGYLNHAVQMAFEGLLNEGSHPFFTLFIELPPDKIDINVHPTKTEIKFEDERTIYGVIRAAVKQALGTHGVAPSIDFDMDVNFNFGQSRKPRGTTSDSSYTQFKTLDSREKNNIDNWEKLYDLYQNTSFEQKEEPALSLTFSSSANERASSGPAETLEERQSSIVQFHNRFIFSAVKSGVMVVDQELAHERILFEKFLDSLEKNSGCAQQFLFPVAIDLSPSDFELILDIQNELTALGFCLEVFGKSSIKLTGAPTEVTDKNEKALFESIIEQYKRNQNELSLSRQENICRSLARRAGIKKGKKMQQEEMQCLIDSLFACKNPNYSPDGRATFYILALPKIEEAFK